MVNKVQMFDWPEVDLDRDYSKELEVSRIKLRKLISAYNLQKAQRTVIASNHSDSITEAFETIRANWGDYSGYRKPSESNEKEFRKYYERLGIIYRCITVGDNRNDIPNQLKKTGTGIYWTWDKDSAVCYWGDDDHPYMAILTAKIDGSEVDWLATVEQYLKPQYAEDEVRLKNNGKVKLIHTELLDREGNMVEYFDQPTIIKIRTN